MWDIDYAELELEGELGKGSFGIVYKANWRQSPVAVKKIAKEKLTEKEISDFTSEALTLMKLRPHINVIHLYGVCNQPLAIVSEFCDGGSLYSKLNKKGEISMEIKLNWLRGISAGMLHLHKEKIIHRDLAARNILIAKDIPKISDFGLSRSISNDESAAHTTSEVGPLKWMSPESLLDRIYSIKTDVWSFGVLMYEIIMQNDPYKDLNPVQAASKVIARQVQLVLPVENPFCELSSRCMNWNPEERPDFEQICKILNTIK